MDAKIASISILEKCKIYFLSVLYGTWVLSKKLLADLFRPNSISQSYREKPPSCLVDSTFGSHNYVKVRGTKFHYVEAGAKDSPLLLLLHGFPDCWLSWKYQIPILSQYFRVVALDLKGFGDSDKPVRSKSYSIDILLEELNEFIAALGASRCTIIAHDLGALLAWYFVHKYSEVVERAVLISCPHPNIFWDNLPSQSNLNLSWLCFVQVPQLPESNALKNDLKIVSDWHPHLQEKDVLLEAYKYTFSRTEDWIGPFNYFRKLPFIRICDISSPIAVSTLLVVGSKDTGAPLENIVKSTDFCEKVVVKIVDDVGHYPQQEKWEEFNNVILKFLKVNVNKPQLERSPSSKGIVNKMFGAVSSTVKYGNSVIDSVHKRTNGVVGSLPMIGFSFNHGSGVVGKSEVS